jgi:transcription elongation factor Elf1
LHTTSCAKCGGERFETATVTADNGTHTITLLHCARCGQALGICEADVLLDALREQQAHLDALRAQLTEVAGALRKLLPA